MTDDIIERAEAALVNSHLSWPYVAKKYIPSLISELKAARAEAERLHFDWEQYG